MMTAAERQRAIAMWGLALCVLASAAGWVFMRFGASWSVGDLPESDWVDHIVPAYIIAEVAFIPIGGKLTDNLGVRPMLILAPFLFVFGSMMCIISVSVEMLVAFRFVQGSGAGIMLALAFTAVGKFYFPHRRGKADELMTAAFAIGSLFGTGVGYFFPEQFNWRFGFVVFSLAMIVGFIVASKTLPEEAHVRSKCDVVGLILAAAAFGTAAFYTQYVEVYFPLLSLEGGFTILPEELVAFRDTSVQIELFGGVNYLFAGDTDSITTYRYIHRMWVDPDFPLEDRGFAVRFIPYYGFGVKFGFDL